MGHVIGMLGCGILAKETAFLIKKNDWPIQAEFLPPSLHIDLRALSDQLTGALKRREAEPPIVLYGCCHPRMDTILADAHTFRIEGQNCLDVLLGYERYMEFLESGAYFLLEDTALNWRAVMLKTFGNKWEIARDIFHGDRKYLLGIRTPCSGDFAIAADAAAKSVDLPLRWYDAPLDHLEQALEAALARWRRENEREYGHAPE